MKISDNDMPMLQKMLSRGWQDGELAEYLNGDQIQSCLRVLKAAGLNQEAGMNPVTRSQDPSQHHQQPKAADAE